jgi:hypothetical protein
MVARRTRISFPLLPVLASAILCPSLDPVASSFLSLTSVTSSSLSSSCVSSAALIRASMNSSRRGVERCVRCRFPLSSFQVQAERSLICSDAERASFTLEPLPSTSKRQKSTASFLFFRLPSRRLPPFPSSLLLPLFPNSSSDGNASRD